MFKIYGFEDITDNDLSSPERFAQFLISKTFSKGEIKKGIPSNLSNLRHYYDLNNIIVKIHNPQITGLEGEFRLWIPGGRVPLDLFFCIYSGVAVSNPAGGRYKSIGAFEDFQHAIKKMYNVGEALTNGDYKLVLKKSIDSYDILSMEIRGEPVISE